MKAPGSKVQISLIGSSEPAQEFVTLAAEIGRLIATKGGVLVCRGLGGIMEAAARGAKEQGGLTIDILPDYTKAAANPFIDVAIPTGLGHARNILVAASGDIVIALPGSHGTRSEISIALKLEKPVFGVKAWGDIPGVRRIDNLAEFFLALLPYF